MIFEVFFKEKIKNNQVLGVPKVPWQEVKLNFGDFFHKNIGKVTKVQVEALL